MKKRIAIVAGGDSSEANVSLKSAEGIKSFIDKERYEAYIVIINKYRWEVELTSDKPNANVDKNDFSFMDCGELKRFDFAYITIHGTPGEDGILQGYFELIGIPYSGCNTLASAITYNKDFCNTYLKSFGIKTPKSILLNSRNRNDIREFTEEAMFPLFVKPNTGGSSFGATKVNKVEQFQPAIDKAFAESNEVLVEEYISGKEVTCGCFSGKCGLKMLPLTEVISKNEIFDFDAKYNGQSEEITPANIEQDLTDKVYMITSTVYEQIQARGLIRVDYIINKSGEPVLLDVNTTPGMTATSFIPQQVRAAGLLIKDVITDIIETELNRLKS